MALYHAARVLMYVLLGLPAGYAAHALSSGSAGRALALVSGVLLLVAATGSFLTRYADSASQRWSAFVLGLAARAAAHTRRHPHAGYALLGAINGLLPCGLVYAAVAAAAAAGSIGAAMLFMAGFGAGTVPLLLAVTLSATAVPRRLRQRLRFVAPALMVAAGLLLIARAIVPPPAGTYKEQIAPVGTHRHL
jgi:uncharacterized protein